VTIVLLSLLILLISFCFMTIDIRINLYLNNRNFEWAMYIKTLFGVINYKLDLPYIKMKQKRWYRLGYKTELESTRDNMDNQDKEKHFSIDEFKNALYRWQKIHQKYKLLIQYFLKKLRIKKIHLHTEYDLDDACVTGILAGIQYAVQSNILFWLTKYKKVQDCSLKINPLFQQENRIIIDFSCIIQFKLGHIINGGIRSFILYKRR